MKWQIVVSLPCWLCCSQRWPYRLVSKMWHSNRVWPPSWTWDAINRSHELSSSVSDLTFLLKFIDNTVDKSDLNSIQGDLEEYEPNLVYIPHALVIHRCDRSTGCCHTLGKSCTSVESEEEDVQFSVRVRAIGKKKQMTARVTMRNHTRCECAEESDFSSRSHRSWKFQIKI